MRTIVIAALLCTLAFPALAVPTCLPEGGSVYFSLEVGKMSESDRAQFYEQILKAHGIDASQTRFWNGCIQTFVTVNGHFTMKFFNPYTLDEVPAN
jgi:hypothetical protein